MGVHRRLVPSCGASILVATLVSATAWAQEQPEAAEPAPSEREPSAEAAPGADAAAEPSTEAAAPTEPETAPAPAEPQAAPAAEPAAVPAAKDPTPPAVAPPQSAAPPPPAAAPAQPVSGGAEASWDTDEVAPPEEPVEEGPSAAIMFNPLGLVLGIANIDLGFGVTRRMSVNFTGQYLSILGVTAYGGGLGMQFFFSGERFDGGFVYPQVQYAFASAEDSDASAQALGFGGIVGYQWTWGVFSLRLGGGAVFYTATGQSGGTEAELSGASLALDASIGFAF